MPENLIWRSRRGRRQPKAHLVHVGKTAGTALKWALIPAAKQGSYELCFHGHADGLRDLPVGDRVFFVLRDPIDRFVSGFLSRERQGRPRYDVPWRPEEKTAFEAFPTAESLGAALSSIEDERRLAAETAMRSIRHVRDSYWRWFHDPTYFASRAEDVLLIMWFPMLTKGFSHLRELLGLGEDVVLPTDDVHAHRNPKTLNHPLSGEARANLQRWYAADYAFIDQCAALPSAVEELRSLRGHEVRRSGRFGGESHLGRGMTRPQRR